jgi:thiamine biosynthesis lipoprotein
MMRRAQPWLGTLVEVSAAGAREGAVASAVTAAFAAIARVHRLMSFHDDGSDVSRLNRALPGEALSVDPATWQVLWLAGQVARLSDGAFDVGCAPLLVQWKLLPPPVTAPPPSRPASEILELEGGDRVRKLAPGWIDLGGIAKGHAVDLAVAALQAAGVRCGCVNAGGDLRVFGDMPFPVAVRAPDAPGQAGARLMLRDEALATSGSYFSARVHNGQPVSALVDPRRGVPMATAPSASVRAPACAIADALTKVVLATGDAEHPVLAAFGASAFIL